MVASFCHTNRSKRDSELRNSLTVVTRRWQREALAASALDALIDRDGQVPTVLASFRVVWVFGCLRYCRTTEWCLWYNINTQ
jgi:hypothetical protein